MTKFSTLKRQIIKREQQFISNRRVAQQRRFLSEQKKLKLRNFRQGQQLKVAQQKAALRQQRMAINRLKMQRRAVTAAKLRKVGRFTKKFFR